MSGPTAGEFDDIERHLAMQVKYFQTMLDTLTSAKTALFDVQDENENLKLQLETYRKREQLRLSSNNTDLKDLVTVEPPKQIPPHNVTSGIVSFTTMIPGCTVKLFESVEPIPNRLTIEHVAGGGGGAGPVEIKGPAGGVRIEPTIALVNYEKFFEGDPEGYQKFQEDQRKLKESQNQSAPKPESD